MAQDACQAYTEMNREEEVSVSRRNLCFLPTRGVIRTWRVAEKSEGKMNGFVLRILTSFVSRFVWSDGSACGRNVDLLSPRFLSACIIY